MKIIIDDKIPYIRRAAESLFSSVVYLPGNKISATDVKDADAMIVRTRTLCDKSLLEGSSVRFIATATIGYDHLDTDYLSHAGISWTNCPGCNASSVAQYVESCLILLKRQHYLPSCPTMGIVGAGHVGLQVALKAQAFNCNVLYNDPPRQSQEPSSAFCSLRDIAEQCDVISFHTPLTCKGPWPTFHLADAAFFDSLRQKPIIINAARGGVVDEQELHRAYLERKVSAYIIDTWENEPHLSSLLLNDAFIGTPHIAGYSADGKSNASQMALAATCKFFGIQPSFNISPPPLPQGLIPSPDEEERKLQLYNPLIDSRALKACPEKFESMRSNYPLRREHW